MQVIIDIPEEMHKSIQQGSFGAKYTIYDLVGCVMNGTPQPKMGHWIKDKCSICGEERAWYGQNPLYCPDCGTKMKEVRNDD